MSKKHKHISATKTTEQKAVQQSQQPQELTPQKLNRLLEKNPFAQLLGMELLEVREGYAYGRMRMDEHFTNIYGGCRQTSKRISKRIRTSAMHSTVNIRKMRMDEHFTNIYRETYG